MTIIEKYPGRTLLASFIFIFFFSLSGRAQSYLDSLKASYEQEKNDSLKIAYAIHLTREIHNNFHNEEEEYGYARDAINRALNLNDTLLYARALDNLGLLYRYHQHYGEAVSLHTKAFKLIKDKKVKPLYKMIFANNVGVAARYNQEYDLSIKYYMKALKIAEQENDLRNIAISTNGIGNALGNIPGREEAALNYFKRSLNAETKRENSLGIAMNYLSISDYYMSRKQFTKARSYLHKLLEINQDRKDRYGLAITYEFYGKCYFKEGKDPEKALFYFQDALQRFLDLGDVHKQSDILFSMGNVQLKQNRISAAKRSYYNSLILARKIGHPGLIMNNSYKLAHIYEEENKPSLALKYIKQGQLYEDSIKLSEQKIEIAALIRKYNLEKKENYIQLLKKDKALQQTLLDNQKQTLERRRIFIILLSIAVLSIFIIALLQYRYAQTKRKTNALIQKEEREKMKAIYEKNMAQAEILVTRLQINPHFLFNSLNAIKYLIQSEQNQKAMKYLVVFSRYTRMVLETAQKHVVPLTEEIKLTHYYLTLEEKRFEIDFTYEIISPDDTELEKINIPPLLLQPFIENAIWHGLLPSRHEKKSLYVKILREENDLKIIIDDNGIGRKKTKPQANKLHKSMGMQITKDRIDLYNKSYLSNISCEIIDKTDEEGGPLGTRVILYITHPNEFSEKTEKSYI